VPQLTEREALDLHELIQANSVTIEKLGTYASQVQDPALRQILSDHQKRHIRGQQEMINHVQQSGAATTWQPAGAGSQPWGTAGQATAGQGSWGPGFASTPGYGGTGYQAGGAAGYGGGQGYTQGYGASQGTAFYGGGEAGGAGMGQKLSDRTIATDCLNDCKQAAVKTITAATEATSPTLRQSLATLSREHLDMAYDMFKFMQSRGWYQVPAASPQVMNQVHQEAMRQQTGLYAQ